MIKLSDHQSGGRFLSSPCFDDAGCFILTKKNLLTKSEIYYKMKKNGEKGR